MFRLLAAFAFVALFAAQPLAQAQSPAPAQPKSGARPAPVRPPVVVNLNTATVAELQQLPGIGAKTAGRIVEYRQKKGPFKKPEELMNVQGIGEKSFLKLKSQITVTGGPAQGAQQEQQD
jgi:competence protein ComEA